MVDEQKCKLSEQNRVIITVSGLAIAFAAGIAGQQVVEEGAVLLVLALNGIVGAGPKLKALIARLGN